MKRKIMFVIGSLGRGGAERVISILSGEYAKQGWNVMVCMLLTNTVGYHIDDSIEIIDMSGTTESRIKRVPYWVKSIRSFVKKENPDVIVSFAARINVITMISCIGLNKKIIVSERNDPQYDGRGIITKILTKILYPFANTVVFQTQRVMSYFDRRIQNKAQIIPNPINVPVYSDNTKLNKIVTVGSLKPQKNQMLLLKSFKIVLEKYPEMTLTIYGEGACRDKLEEYIQIQDMQKNVFLPGEMDMVHEEIKDALMFVLPSDYEGLSNALLEAMMMGLPCISTNCAGSDEYILNGENGLLVQVGDREKLAEAIIKFIENDDLREKCARNARKIRDRVGLEKTLFRWHEVID